MWYRSSSKSEVIGPCGGDEKPEWPRKTDKKSNAKNKTIKQHFWNPNSVQYRGLITVYVYIFFKFIAAHQPMFWFEIHLYCKILTA